MTSRTRKQALEMIKELQEEIGDANDRVMAEKELIDANDEQIKKLRQMMDNLPDVDQTQLGRLHEIVQHEGTGHERAIVERAYKGEDLGSEDAERVKSLAIQFLQETMEAV